MITLKHLNVVRKVATEEEAAKLEARGFVRVLDKAARSPKGKEAAPPKGEKKDSPPKGGKKEDNDGGADQPDSGDGAK